MTVKEQIENEENLRFPPTKSIVNSMVRDVFREGAEYGYNLALERVCEYLELPLTAFIGREDAKEFITAFRQAMGGGAE